MSVRDSAFRQYFRQSHISMTPGLSWAEFKNTLILRRGLPEGMPQRPSQFTFNGSAAIHAAVAEMGLGSADAVLLPAYCCGAELGPFQQAGCELLFYDVQDDLSADFDEINKNLQSWDNIRLVFVTHYLGFAQTRLAELARVCARYNARLLEDCAHCLFAEFNNEPLGQHGDYAVFSPRKSLPLSEGGVLLASSEFSVVANNRSSPPCLARWERIVYSLQQGARGPVESVLRGHLSRITIAVCLLPAVVLKLVKRCRSGVPAYWITPDVEGQQAVPAYSWSMSRFSFQLLRSSDGASIRASRRKSYQQWLLAIAGIEGVEALIAGLPEGACPLYFPVLVDSPAAVTQALAALDIEAFNWWQHHHSMIDWSLFPVADRLKRSVVALPVHQTLGAGDIAIMAAALKQVLVQAN